MRYTTPNAFRTALERRLQNKSHKLDVPLIHLRKLVTFDRFLARLLLTSPDRWVLKGALALDYRLEGSFRTTNDLDLSRISDGSVDAVIHDFLAAQSLELDDYFSFAVQGADQLTPTDGTAVRFRARAELAGRPFETVTIDVGLHDPLFSSPELVRGPDLLAFAEIESIVTPALPLAQHIAEKVHAYSRMYPGQRRSSRVKDLADIVIMQSHQPFEAGRLRAALEVIFNHRATHPIPEQFPTPPANWQVAYRRLAIEIGIDPDLFSGHQRVSAFLDPILGTTIPSYAIWDWESAHWSMDSSATGQ